MTPIPELSIVIPCYNSERSLPELMERIEKTLAAAGISFEIICVEDGSRDGTWRVIRELAGKYPFIHGFRLMRNFGQHNALLCGIRAARGPMIVTIDDDLQNPPEEIPRLIATLRSGYDVVYGSPRRHSHGLLRDLASQMTKFVLQKSMGAETARSISAYRIFRTRLRNAFADFRGSFVSIDVLLTWGGQRFTSIPVEALPRTFGTSNYTLYKLAVHSLNMITGFSTLPLQMASIFGFVFTIFGILMLLYVIGGFLLRGSPVQGFTFLASTIAIFSGAQLFSLGVMGEYLARIHLRTSDKPTFAVATTTEENPADGE